MVEKKELEKLILQNKKSNLKNHWNDAFHCNTTKYSGEIRSSELLIWRSAYFVRRIYPIFRITFDQNNKLNKIEIEKNPYHKLLDKITIGALIILISSLLLSTNLRTAIAGTIGILCIGILSNLILKKYREKEITLLTDELKETLETLEKLNHPELVTTSKSESKKKNLKEWTFTKIIARIFLYPFCLLMFYFSIQMILNPNPNHIKQILCGILGLICIGAYLITDITLILKNLALTKNRR